MAAGTSNFSFYKRPRKNKKPMIYVQLRLPDGTRKPGRSTGVELTVTNNMITIDTRLV